MQSGGSACMADSKYVKWGTHLTIKKSKSWKKQVKIKNKGKNGRRFVYSDKLFESLAIIKTYTGISYRACQGIAQNVLGSNAPDHTTICRRINALKIKTPESPSDQLKDIYLAIDGSGIKPNERGEWIRDKWKIRRGFIKIHFLINVKTRKIVSFTVTTEEKTDSSQFSILLKAASKIASTTAADKRNIVLYGDGAYDTNANFNRCQKLGIKPMIKVRSNSALHAGRYARNDAVREQLEEIKHLAFTPNDAMLKNQAEWKKRVRYGQRWIIEVVFSAFKGFCHVKKMGSHRARASIKGMVYNMFCDAGLSTP
ncbi:MAG: Transposase [Cenarchaeum symbiont of Oopsacas minuta]|nr:Transposase [Cenarchaeum symbiont of Oopsacas minuta]